MHFQLSFFYGLSEQMNFKRPGCYQIFSTLRIENRILISIAV